MSDFKIRATRKAEATTGNMQNMDAWTCILTNPRGKRMQTTFYMGYGHRGQAPTVEQVLESLISDASCYESATDAWDFAQNFGYDDANFDEAERVYKACGRIAAKLGAFMTEDEREKYRDQ